MDIEDKEADIEKTRKTVELVGTSISLLDDGDESPLTKLTDMERGFVEAYAALAGQHGAQTQAARYAGYKNPTIEGGKKIRNPKILAALRYLTEHKAHASAIIAMRTMEDIMLNGTDALRLKASERLLGYAGIITKTIHKHEHEIKDNRSPAQIKKAIAEKAARLGIPVGELVDISPDKPKKETPTPPRYKKALIPNRPLSDEEVDDIDWLNSKVTTK